MMITDTSFFRNRNYHEAGDTPETLDYARMAKVVRAVHRGDGILMRISRRNSLGCSPAHPARGCA